MVLQTTSRGWNLSTKTETKCQTKCRKTNKINKNVKVRNRQEILEHPRCGMRWNISIQKMSIDSSNLKNFPSSVW